MKQYIYLLCALLGIGLYSCSHEETALEGTSNRITVSFNLPDTDSDTRADATTEATDEEKALHQVDLYCFDYADGKIGTLKSITHLSNPANADNNISLGVGTYHIEAIANESSLNLTEGSSSYEDFLKLRATSGDYDSWSTTGGIKMQGSQKTKVTNGTASMNINFTMIRMVGRIDVVNKVPGLTITKALLENSVIESFYLEDTESTIAQEEGKTGDFTAIGLSVAPDASARIFYAYEGAVEHSKLQVSFEGTDANGTLHSSLPIVEFTNQNAQPAIKRNKLYVVTLEEVDGSVEATVTVSDWNQKNIDAEVSVDDGNDILIHGDEGEDIDIKNNGNNQYTLYVPAKAATYTLNIDNVNIELEAGETPDVNWMSLTAVDTRALNQSLKLTVEENTDSDNQRTAKFEIYSKLDGKVVATCTVVQEKAEKPEPEPGIDWEQKPSVTVSGAATLEQWADSYDVVGENGKSFFMFATPSPAVDETSPVTDFDKRGGDWDSAGDPSKEGYHMATKADWQALAEVSRKAGYGYTYLTLNGKRYYIHGNSTGYNKVKIVFQECDEEGNMIGEQKKIEFGGGGSIATTYKSTSPWNCTKVRKNSVSRYWCGGGIPAYYVDLSYSVSVMNVPSGIGSNKGIEWYAMRIRSIKNN